MRDNHFSLVALSHARSKHCAEVLATRRKEGLSPTRVEGEVGFHKQETDRHVRGRIRHYILVYILDSGEGSKPNNLGPLEQALWKVTHRFGKNTWNAKHNVSRGITHAYSTHISDAPCARRPGSLS